MRIATFILLPWLVFSQEVGEKHWIKWNGEWTNPTQRDFAAWCYDYGTETGDRGHTLMWLGKNESSWNVNINGDGGKSLGPFQMDSTTALWVADRMDIEILPKDIRAVLENDRATAADLALAYFDFWYKKYYKIYEHKGLAWTLAIKSYRYGYKHFKADEEWVAKANSWVRFFKTIHK